MSEEKTFRAFPGDVERGKYGVPVDDIKTYVDRAVKDLNLDSTIINDMDSAMYKHRLSHNDSNLEVAKKVLDMPDGSLSQLARAMADATPEVQKQIESDPKYELPPPQAYS